MKVCIRTTSFNDFSIEAGILLRGNGVPHAMAARRKLPRRPPPHFRRWSWSGPRVTMTGSGSAVAVAVHAAVSRAS